jgi:P27 family predicted phage terminase small subunit
MSANTARPAPEHLTDESASWWDTIASRYHLSEVDYRLLRLACEAWDGAQASREAVAEDGAAIRDRFDQVKTNPLLIEERQQRDSFARLVREMGLDGDAVPDTRPPRRN